MDVFYAIRSAQRAYFKVSSDLTYGFLRLMARLIPSSPELLGCACSAGQHRAGVKWPDRPEPMICTDLGPTVPEGSVIIRCLACGTETPPLSEREAILDWNLMTMRTLRGYALGPSVPLDEGD